MTWRSATGRPTVVPSFAPAGLVVLLLLVVLVVPVADAQPGVPAGAVTLEDSLAIVAPDVRLGAPVPAACPVASLWANLEWQWRGTPTTMIDAVRRLGALREGAAGDAREQDALEHIRAAQRDPIVANRYRSCRDASPGLFWRLVLTAAAPHAAPLERCLGDLDWERGADPRALREAVRRIEAPGADELAPAAAMARLLDGQRHNPRAMERYRACWRDAPESWWEAVRGRSR